MKKLLSILIIVFLSIGNINASDTLNLHLNNRDTTIVLEHPNSKDSLMVVKVVKSVVSVISVPIQRPLLVKLLNDPAFQSGLAGLVLVLWRRFEIRKIKRKLGYKKPPKDSK